MIGLLASLKADLLGRRLLPLVVALALALAGAVAYAVLGGSSSSSSSNSSSAGSLAASLPPAPPSLASPAPPNPHLATAETTTGVHFQRAGSAHDPFKKLPEPEKAKALTTSSSSSASSSKGAAGGGTPSGSGATPTGPSNPKPETPKKKTQPTSSYQVALLFGLAPPAGQPPQLVPYANLKRLTPLPDAEHPLIIYSGVSAGGTAAVFALLHEAIVKGGGSCLPSETQCEMVRVPVGKTEELQYVGNEGQAVVYLLQVVSIVKHEGATGGFAGRFSKAGNRLLHEAGLTAVEDLRYLPRRDVVVFTAQHPR
jgi:hypothetical protein